MIFEYLVISLLALSGYGLLSISNFAPVERSLFALPAAMSVYIIVAYVQIILGSNTSYYVTIAILAGCSLICAIANFKKLESRDVIYIPILFIVFSIVFLISNQISLVKFHFDSIRYLTVSSLLAYDKFDEITDYVLRRRFTPIGILHAPAHLSDNFYLRSLTPVIAVNLVLILYYTVYSTFESIYDSMRSHMLAIAAALLLVSINRTTLHAFYINNHLLEALYILVVAGAGWLCARGRMAPGPATLLIGLGVFGVVVCRAEGFIMAGLVLIPILLSDTLPKSNRIALGQVWGLAVLLQVAPVVLRAVDIGGAVHSDTAKLLLLAVIICAASPAVYLGFFTRNADKLLLLAQVLLWLVLIGFVLADWKLFAISVKATFINVVYGGGGWGVALIVLAALVAASLAAPRVKARSLLWFPVTGFVPVVFILAYLRDNPYRVGDTDSLNRMWFHIVPLAVLLVASAALYAKDHRKTARLSDRSADATS